MTEGGEALSVFKKIPHFRIMLLKKIFLIVVVITTCTSCLTYKQIVNFQDGQDLGQQNKLDTIQNAIQIRLQPDDVVMVNVFSYNMDEAAKFNSIPPAQLAMMQQQAGSGANIMEPLGYRVSRAGEIDLPIVGRLKVQNLTIDELHDLVQQKVEATGFLKNPSVQVRFLSFRITVLGEVNAPGSFTIATPKITVLEAIGLARDVTIFSNRDNILVVREQNGIRKFGRIDLKSKAIFESPYFYLQPNDVVYVEPHKSKVLAAPDPASRYVGAFVGIASLATLIITLFR